MHGQSLLTIAHSLHGTQHAFKVPPHEPPVWLDAFGKAHSLEYQEAFHRVSLTKNQVSRWEAFAGSLVYEKTEGSSGLRGRRSIPD